MDRTVIDNEEARLNALRDLNLLDTPPSESFDRITRLASRLFHSPVSTISLTDRDRQWFKSRVGVDLAEIPRSEAPCAYAVQNDAVFVVSDMEEDPRFKGGLLASVGIRFYAGAPLITRAGYGLGTLCIIGDKPRDFSQEESQVLADLAAMVMSQIELQNAFGCIDATSGQPNEHQLFEDLDDLSAREPGAACTALLIEFASPPQVTHGQRVLGATYAAFIRQSVERIRSLLKPAQRVYHVGPARCAIVLRGEAPDELRDIIHDLTVGLRAFVLCAGIPLTPDPVFGVCAFQLGAVAPRDVLRRMFNAAADARNNGDSVAAYDEGHDLAHRRRFLLLNDIGSALKHPGELRLVYQPRVDLRNGRCVGAEALLRWRHPQLGEVSPAEFMPLFEDTAFTVLLTDWVLDQAIAQQAIWDRSGGFHRISINVSARNLEDPRFAERLAAILARHGVAPGAIELEFTESALLTRSTSILSEIAALRDMGVAMSIDDFGTGYSCLSYLQRLPINLIKVDRSFITHLATNTYDQKLVRALIGMAHDLGYGVVAEGVETQETYDMLVGWGCDEAQGFLISRPLAPEAMESWVNPERVAARA